MGWTGQEHEAHHLGDRRRAKLFGEIGAVGFNRAW
jgi:hypothetical protein